MNPISVRRRAAIVSCAVLAASAGVVRGDFQQAGTSSTAGQNAFDANIVGTDLINATTATFRQQITGGTTSNGGAGGGTFDKLNDGIASNKVGTVNDLSGDTFFAANDLRGTPTSTFFLNTTANPAGYDLTSIRTINGWADTQTFNNQRYTVSVRTVNSTLFRPIGTVDYAPFASNGSTGAASQVTVTDTTGKLATNIDAVRFTYLTSSVAGGNGQVVREIDVFGAASATPAPAAPAPVPTIFPLGDSITYGDLPVGNGGPINGGYRTKLDAQLRAAGRSFNFVGSQTANASTGLTNSGQVANEGHNGYRTGQMTANLTGFDAAGGSSNGGHWLDGGNGTGRDAINPDYILIHAGTNNLLQGNTVAASTAELDLLIARLRTERPSAVLMVSSLIPINDSRNANVKLYNAYIRDTLVPTYRAQGAPVYFVDQYANFVDANGNVIGSLLPDNVHPGQAGYDMMGATWANAILAVPEPTGLGMAMAAGAGLLRRRRRRGGEAA